MSAVSSGRMHRAVRQNGKARSTVQKSHATSVRMDPLQVIGSLVAILALSGLAWWLGLGGASTIENEREARRLAGEIHDGFEASQIVLDHSGASALLQSQAGDILLIKRHGNQFAGRILAESASARLDGSELIVDSGEARFGSVILRVNEAPYWADAINRLNVPADA